MLAVEEQQRLVHVGEEEPSLHMVHDIVIHFGVSNTEVWLPIMHWHDTKVRLQRMQETRHTRWCNRRSSPEDGSTVGCKADPRSGQWGFEEVKSAARSALGGSECQLCGVAWACGRGKTGCRPMPSPRRLRLTTSCTPSGSCEPCRLACTTAREKAQGKSQHPFVHTRILCQV